MRLFFTLKKNQGTEITAAKSSFSRATGYRYARDPFLSERKAAPRDRRRLDPLADIFEAELVPTVVPSARLAAMCTHGYRRPAASQWRQFLQFHSLPRGSRTVWPRT